jgi:hypothetical protein
VLCSTVGHLRPKARMFRDLDISAGAGGPSDVLDDNTLRCPGQAGGTDQGQTPSVMGDQKRFASSGTSSPVVSHSSVRTLALIGAAGGVPAPHQGYSIPGTDYACGRGLTVLR